MIRLLMVFVLVSSGCVALAQKQDKIKIETSAMCEMCKMRIEKDMTFEKGVKTANLDLKTKLLEVNYNPKRTSADKIRKRLTEIGYRADTLKANLKAFEKLPFCCQENCIHHDND